MSDFGLRPIIRQCCGWKPGIVQDDQPVLMNEKKAGGEMLDRAELFSRCKRLGKLSEALQEFAIGLGIGGQVPIFSRQLSKTGASASDFGGEGDGSVG